MPRNKSKKEAGGVTLSKTRKKPRSSNKTIVVMNDKLYVINKPKVTAHYRIVFETPRIERTFSAKPHDPKIKPGSVKSGTPIPTKERRSYYGTKQQESNP